MMAINLYFSSLLVVEGVGIKEGTAGQPVLFKLDGRKAGPGRLSCKCKAPSGKTTAVRILDNADGTYNIDLNAKEPGTHTVELDWDGQPVPGSPFAVKISQSPDVGKVKCYGPGLKNGVLGKSNRKILVFWTFSEWRIVIEKTRCNTGGGGGAGGLPYKAIRDVPFFRVSFSA